MAVHSRTSPCWQQLASGKLSTIRTQHLGTQLMTKRVERSNEPIADKANEIYNFFLKWEKILPAEIQQISKM